MCIATDGKEKVTVHLESELFVRWKMMNRELSVCICPSPAP